MYREWAERYFADPRFMANFASFGGGMGPVMAMSLSDKVRDNPISGVSPFMHIVACGRGTVSEAKVPAARWDDGSEPKAHFPQVADRYADFVKLADTFGSEAASAVA